MKKLGWVGVLAGVLLLAGCSAPTGDAAESAPNETSAPQLTAAPAPAAEEEFLTAAQRIVGLEDVTLEAALPVGEEICAELDAGADPLTMTPIENGTEATNEEMVIVSVLTLCTEHNDATQQKFVDRRVARPAS